MEGYKDNSIKATHNLHFTKPHIMMSTMGVSSVVALRGGGNRTRFRI